jgi:N-acetyl-gamma-glutamylphosphate reductase
MKIVVIGGSGLIGSKTVAILRRGGHDVFAASPAEAIQTTTSKNGTRIALDRTGTGAALLILAEVERKGAPRPNSQAVYGPVELIAEEVRQHSLVANPPKK